MNVLHATAGVAGFGFVVLAEELVPRRIAREVRVGDVGAGGDDAQAVAPRVGEGGVAEARGEAPPALAPRHVRVHHVHRRRRRGRAAGGCSRQGDEAVLEESPAVGRLEPPRLLPPHDAVLRRFPLAGAALLRHRGRLLCFSFFRVLFWDSKAVLALWGRHALVKKKGGK